MNPDYIVIFPEDQTWCTCLLVSGKWRYVRKVVTHICRDRLTAAIHRCSPRIFLLFWPKRRGRLTRITRLKPHCSEFLFLTGFISVRLQLSVLYTDRFTTIKIDLSVVELIVGDDFNDISDQKTACQYGLYSQWLYCQALLWTASRTSWSPLWLIRYGILNNICFCHRTAGNVNILEAYL